MTYAVDLSGCWAKLDRANLHTDTLRREIAEVWEPYSRGIPTRREYDAHERAVIYRVEDLPEIPGHWSLMIGEILHNLRCVLDHLAWQLAVRFHGGNEPSEKEGRNVQFPVIRDATKWATHLHTQQMLPDDRDFLEKLQPYHPRTGSERNGLLDLALLSNHDKHRLVHVLTTAATTGNFENTIDGWRDCLPDKRPGPDGTPIDWMLQGIRVLEPNLEIARVFVIATGPHPDRDLKAHLTGKITMESPSSLNMPVEYSVEPVDFFAAATDGLSQVLRHFEPNV